MTENDLNKIELITNAATEGPWDIKEATDKQGNSWATAVGPVYYSSGAGECVCSLKDAAFIATARIAVPELIKEIRALKAKLGANG